MRDVAVAARAAQARLALAGRQQAVPAHDVHLISSGESSGELD
jgi:hypothetical protein